MLLHMHRGTPYIYEGEELGMTNAHFTKLDQYRDLEAINAYRQRVEEARCQSPESMMAALALIGRDNSRTPMQWDASRYAGFTAADAATEPWIGVNPNHVEINVAEEFDDLIPCTASTRSSSHAPRQRDRRDGRVESGRGRQRAGVFVHPYRRRRYDSRHGQSHR